MVSATHHSSHDGTDISIVSPPTHRDVLIRWDEIVRRIEIDPTNSWAPGRDPGMRFIRSDEFSMPLGRVA
jgi:hypothetical protein